MRAGAGSRNAAQSDARSAPRRPRPTAAISHIICPGVTESELADTITEPDAAAAMREYRAGALPASAIASAISSAVSAEEGVDVNENIVRPVA